MLGFVTVTTTAKESTLGGRPCGLSHKMHHFPLPLCCFDSFVCVVAALYPVITLNLSHLKIPQGTHFFMGVALGLGVSANYLHTRN